MIKLIFSERAGGGQRRAIVKPSELGYKIGANLFVIARRNFRPEPKKEYFVPVDSDPRSDPGKEYVILSSFGSCMEIDGSRAIPCRARRAEIPRHLSLIEKLREHLERLETAFRKNNNNASHKKNRENGGRRK